MVMEFSLAAKTRPYMMLIIYLLILLQLCGVFSKPVAKQTNSSTDVNNTHHDCTNSAHKIKVAKFDFKYIATPFIVSLWVLLASLLKLGLHMTTKLSKYVPESCMIILLGVLLGGLLSVIGYSSVAEIPFFTSRIFFLFLLPPIVLEAGYFLHTSAFFDNIGTILLYAVVGTLFNTFTVGLTLYSTRSFCGLNVTLLQMLLFSCLISAVDPVAVLAVFEEVHVNEVLYILVFGESLLNDAVTVVLYRLFESLASQESVEVQEVFIGVAAFFVVSFGGFIIGIIWAFITAFLTKYTDHVRVLEPIFVFAMSYMAYLTAELFHFSGIISIVTCAMVMKPYVEANISEKSRIPLKYFMKMASSLSETIIFMLLGVILFNKEMEYNAYFIVLTIIFISIYRCVGVVLLTWLANKTGRLNNLGKVEQFVMAYGGIRGAVAFSLATLICNDVPEKRVMEATAIAVVLFTVFVQGMTIKPIVGFLKVKRAVKRRGLMLGEVNDKLMDHLLGGIQDVIHHRGHYYWKNLYQYADFTYLRPWFMRRKSDTMAMDETLLMVYRKLSYRDAMMHASKPVPSNSNGSDDDFESVVKDRRSSSGLAPCVIQSEECDKFKDTYNHVHLAFLLGKPVKGTVHRHFSRNNVYEPNDIGEEALRMRRRSNVHNVPGSLKLARGAHRDSTNTAVTGHEPEEKDRPRSRRPHKHGRKHGHHGKGKKHQEVRKQLSDILESPKSSSPDIDPPDIDPPHQAEPAAVVKEPADDEPSSASESETKGLLPKLADIEPSSPTLDMHFTDVGEPEVSVDRHAFLPSDRDDVGETVM